MSEDIARWNKPRTAIESAPTRMGAATFNK